MVELGAPTWTRSRLQGPSSVVQTVDKIHKRLAEADDADDPATVVTKKGRVRK